MYIVLVVLDVPSIRLAVVSVCVVVDTRFCVFLLGWFPADSSDAGVRPLSSGGQDPWWIPCREGVGQGRFNKVAGLVECRIFALALFLVAMVADRGAADDFCSIDVVQDGRGLVLRIRWWWAGGRIQRGSPDLSAVGGGFGIGGALGPSHADELQWCLSRRAATGFPCGQQSVRYAMECFPIQQWLLLVFFSPGGFGGWRVRRRASVRISREDLKDRFVIFLFVGVLSLLFWVFSFLVLPGACVCTGLFSVFWC